MFYLYANKLIFSYPDLHETMNRFIQIVAATAFLLLMATSCKKEPVTEDQGKTMKDLVVPEGFNFEMTKSIRMSIQLPSTISYSSTNRIIQIWTENPEGRPGQLIKTGSADHNGTYEVSFSLPASTNKLFTNCFAGWRSVIIRGAGMASTDGSFKIDYNTGYGKTPPDPRQASPGESPNKVISIHDADKTGIKNVLNNGDFNVSQLGSMSEWSSPLELDSIWYSTDEANGYASIVTEEGNSFARINSGKYTAGGVTQLIRAAPGQVVTFSGDTRGFDSRQDVYLYLIPRNEHGECIDFFSFNLVDPGIAWANGTVVGSMPEGTVTCQILFFKGSTGIVDFDNAVVRVNDLDADRDGDGVPDWEDIYPDNARQAFDDTFPGKDTLGTIAFEDSWPLQNDYDFNDMIVDYQISRISNASNRVVEIDVTTRVRAIGSSISHGFGMQMYLSSDRIAGIKSDYEFVDDAIRLNENGTETGQQWATFILFDDAYKLLTHPGDGSPTINTTMGYHFLVPSEFSFRIYLKDPADPETVTFIKFNPFIFRTDERSRETHLKGFPPTDLANQSLFGTGDDASNLVAGSSYQTKNGLPWAINLPVQFDYPIEKTELLKSYPVFASWSSSGGNDYEDWYMDKIGYRKWENIYRW